MTNTRQGARRPSTMGPDRSGANRTVWSLCRIPLSDVPTDGPPEAIFAALSATDSTAFNWLHLRRRIMNFCLGVKDREERRKLYRALITIYMRDHEPPGG